ncbi:MAG: chromosome segregation protein SMC [Eubacteriales bacterium]|nr:chromosome segregation protein SMC [Eubacteriales bacterium]
MYLKSIEIQGFKSFAHKTLLNFNKGVTGIVGPNGSGKSNISDAVRWVLGEQKAKQLRGAAMQDVIFAGTELRKAQGFAYVSITLDNSDHTLPVDYIEVTVSRKLFRSGESDYMINGQSVRLKDVQELFYDTGIGKEGYSIIGQGQVDAIINGRPQDRRGLFDEAAGIVKFKKRKLSAVKRLESERENLIRITDILSELEKRLRPLERQSETARTYLKLRDEQKILDLNLFIRQTESLLNDLRKSKDNLSIVKASLEESEAENAELKETGSGITEEINALDSFIEEKRSEQSKGQLLKENLSGQISVSEAEIKSDKDSIERLLKQAEKLEAEIAETKRTALNYLRSIAELDKSIDLIEDDIEDEGIDFTDIAVLKSNISAMKKKLDAAGIKEAGAEKSGVGISGDNTESEAKDGQPDAGANAKGPGDSAEAESTKADEDDEEFSFKLPDWMKSIKNKKDDLAEISEKAERTNEWLNKATDEYNVLTKEIKSLENNLSEIQNREAAVNARLESVRNIAERYEGYGESVRAVMREKNRLGGIRGVVADLIRTGKDYETAVETALGGRIQNIVTDSEKNAKNGIEFLKRTRQGRATFLPLDSIRFREQMELKGARHEHGAIGLASELVEAAPEYEELKQYLLGSYLVVDNIDNALIIARKYKHSIRIVTLEGELLSPGGSISGGAFKNNSKLMGRNREIGELEQSLAGIRKQAAAAKDKINKQERLILDKSGEIDELTESLNSINEEKNQLSFGISSDMKVQFSGLRQKIEFVGENIDRVIGELSSKQTELLNADNERSECEKRVSDAEKYISDRKDDIEHIEKELSGVSEIIDKKLAEKEELQKRQSGYSERKEELAASILELQKDVIRLENQVEKQQQRLDDETEYIWNEYELSLSSAQGYLDESLGSTPAIRSRLASVKSDIKNLGPVNVQAIEEYKEVSERYTFMKTQYDDIAASEESILKIIEELDEGMRRQFDEQFGIIKEQFKKVFRELFGGGEADLSLVYDQDSDEPEDELEAGIAITVQPPGKKLQNIMQLSGGEKALSAIALLFAIQNLKPSPFCLLDEIEAALDDSNVSRFANYLHKLTERTQFIVITHRRGTMEASDRLYGVTMQEKGISKLVSVDLVSDQLS